LYEPEIPALFAHSAGVSPVIGPSLSGTGLKMDGDFPYRNRVAPKSKHGKKTDVEELSKEFVHAGLLTSEPPATAGCSLSSLPTTSEAIDG
jgi:hypothetical protein